MHNKTPPLLIPSTITRERAHNTQVCAQNNEGRVARQYWDLRGESQEYLMSYSAQVLQSWKQPHTNKC